MHPHIPRPRRKATRTDTAGVVRTVHGEFMWPFTARVNEKTAPIERIAAVAICRRLPPRCASQQNRKFNVRFGSKADICSATSHVRFTSNSDRESRHSRRLHPPDAGRSPSAPCRSRAAPRRASIRRPCSGSAARRRSAPLSPGSARQAVRPRDDRASRRRACRGS
jgi:hypothetical protein